MGGAAGTPEFGVAGGATIQAAREPHSDFSALQLSPFLRFVHSPILPALGFESGSLKLGKRRLEREGGKGQYIGLGKPGKRWRRQGGQDGLVRGIGRVLGSFT